MKARHRFFPLLTFAAAAAIVAVAVSIYLTWEKAMAPTAPPVPSSFDRQLVLHGSRVAALGDCAVCHTAPGGKPYAGGLPLATPFGTIYTTNITPDAETGIGSWSLEAFTRAMRRGISRDGHQLYPAFPYIHYTRMSDGDIAAAYAFLMQRDPVVSKAPDNALIFPLNFRPLVAFWNVLFLREGPEPKDASRDDKWNRGRELVNGLGHCAACHTPLNPIGGEQWGKAFDGGVVDGWEAPSLNTLTSSPHPWTKSQLIAYLRTGMSSQHSAAAGPMLPVTQELATVPEEDVDAIATYLLSLQKPPTRDVMPPDHAGADKTSIQRGAVLFSAACAACHGENSPMQSLGQRPSLATSTTVNAATPRNTVKMMLEGVQWQGEREVHYMPPFKHMLNDRQVADIANYLRATYTDQPPWKDVVQTAADIRKGDKSR